MKKALQLYYTSCKKGLSSGSGFQTFSMSEGISNEERLEIEHYGLYVAPLDMPSQPSMEEVATMFPTSFSFFRLRTGRFGVARSKYVGKDYSGRFGNYFVHALILNDGLFPFHPIRLFGSSIFRDGLTEQEMDVPQAPDPLPSLGIDDLALDGNLDQNIVREFVQNNHRGEVIEKIVAATLAFETSHRPLVFCDSWKNIPYWIGALQMAFPVNMAHASPSIPIPLIRKPAIRLYVRRAEPEADLISPNTNAISNTISLIFWTIVPALWKRSPNMALWHRRGIRFQRVPFLPFMTLLRSSSFGR